MYYAIFNLLLVTLYLTYFLAIEPDKRQSVTSVGSGSVSELRLDEKRLSDAYSLTESRDYTFEESEDDIGTHGTHVDVLKEKVESKQEERPKSPGKYIISIFFL